MYTRGQRWITLRPILRRVGIGCLIAFDVLTILFYAWSYVDYGIIDYFKERAMIGSIAEGTDDLRAVSVARAATALQVSSVDIFSLGDGRVDFLAYLANPNEDWYVQFTYSFTYGSATTDTRVGFLLPGESRKPITELAVDVETIPSRATLTIGDLEWVRLNHHAITDYTAWQTDRLRFTYTDVTYDRAVPIDTTTVGRSTFNIKNTSPYGYYDARFHLILLRNEKPVGVTRFSLANFEPGESRTLSISWFGEAPQANETLIVPDIDIFDPASYMPIRGETQPDVRERIPTGRRR